MVGQYVVCICARFHLPRIKFDGALPLTITEGKNKFFGYCVNDHVLGLATAYINQQSNAPGIEMKLTCGDVINGKKTSI
jgi:hypothetical protein